MDTQRNLDSTSQRSSAQARRNLKLLSLATVHCDGSLNIETGEIHIHPLGALRELVNYLGL